MEKSEFERRRQQLIDIMGEGSIAMIPAAPEVIRNRDVHYAYRPDSDFYYLTGFPEPEALAVIMPEREQGQYILFCREKDKEKETWHGKRAGLEGACEIYGADDAFPITDIDEIVPGLMESCHRVYYPMGCHPELDEKVIGWMNNLRQQARKGVCAPREIFTLDHVLHDMRLYKSEAELQAIRAAVAITVRSHQRAMQTCKPWLFEYQLEAELNHEFMYSGSRYSSYPAIVAGGANACILHYTENDCILNDGDLVLIDAGAEFDFYAADVTRTFPVNGVFTEPQKTIYNLVLAAQKAAIDKVYPGNRWDEPHEAAVQVITEGLKALGLLIGKLDTLIEEEAYKKFFMHRTCHWLGMDVHDVGEYKIEQTWRILEPNMVMTVEPGIYIPAGTEGVSEEWWNIGVRIEDNILVTEAGNEVLTRALPRSVNEIEMLMAGGGMDV